MLAEFGQPEIALAPVFALPPSEGGVDQWDSRAICGLARTEITASSSGDGKGPQTKQGKINPDRRGHRGSDVYQPVKIRGFINLPTTQKQKRAPTTSATQRPQRPLCRNSVMRPKSEKSQSSAGSSSPSASRSGEPARICSAIRPEFWRIAASILAVMSGLALRNALEFSRPWPSRWLS